MPDGRCDYDHCRNPARLYPGGWRCDPHSPSAEHGRTGPVTPVTKPTTDHSGQETTR